MTRQSHLTLAVDNRKVEQRGLIPQYRFVSVSAEVMEFKRTLEAHLIIRGRVYMVLPTYEFEIAA